MVNQAKELVAEKEKKETEKIFINSYAMEEVKKINAAIMTLQEKLKSFLIGVLTGMDIDPNKYGVNIKTGELIQTEEPEDGEKA